jgi:hypothetical protein
MDDGSVREYNEGEIRYLKGSERRAPVAAQQQMAAQANDAIIGPWRIPEGLTFLAERSIIPQDLAGLSVQELSRLRNFIYARHGRAFTNPELRQFFEGQAWYRVDAGYADSALSAVERENVRIIKAMEEARKPGS